MSYANQFKGSECTLESHPGFIKYSLNTLRLFWSFSSDQFISPVKVVLTAGSRSQYYTRSVLCHVNLACTAPCFTLPPPSLESRIRGIRTSLYLMDRAFLPISFNTVITVKPVFL